MSGYADALALIAETIAGAVRPQPPVPVSQWLASNLVLVDGPNAGELWSPDGAPYLAEIADLLSDDHPCNLVTIRKSQQTGASILALGWCLYVAAREPANMLYAVPGLDALRDLNGQKLGPLIDAWHNHLARQRPRRGPVIQPQTSRSGVGSTTFEKKFVGGYMALANANAAMDLSSKTVKKGVKDEMSKWQDIPGFGDPETLFFGRFTAFRRTRDYKILEISTPEEDSGDELGEGPNHCRIDRSFRRSDQRYWHLACPECGCEQTWTHKPTISTRDLASGDAAVGKGGVFLVDLDHPHKSVLVCAGCGHLISEPERVAMVRAGRWIPTATEPDRHHGYHLDAYISLMMSLEAMGEDWRNMQRAGTEKAEKDYSNLVLGLPYRYRGDAPDHMRLMERREDYPRGKVPAGALMITAFCDVQHSGIFFEVVAWAPDRASWTIDVGFLTGDTTDHRRGAWASLAEVYERTYETRWGQRMQADAFGVDAGDASGGRANQVYAWCAARINAYAMKGQDGWATPAISSQAKPVDIDLDGRVQKNGAQLWRTGTWPLKREFYDNLRKGMMGDNGVVDYPPGFCHFGLWLDEVYFKQITSEYLQDTIVRGKVTGRKWAKRGENHYLDCRIGNMALAEHLGLTAMSEDDWRTLARARQAPDDMLTPDLFAPEPIKARAAAPPPQSPEPPPPPPDDPGDGGWIAPRSNWFDR
ncbi:terminase [Camelimonas fluminis]|uniref:Terminase gpA endonuclease subunit n=1 Tax=Camelimonas fluminis TaxID=1576911 RepID=A0ABV7UEW9_9HYPH|nr:terminase gpA endonuclease subunit [Camelimonas fluminis]GHE50940.1 terminase [Camelimonas fluminis]